MKKKTKSTIFNSNYTEFEQKMRIEFNLFDYIIGQVSSMKYKNRKWMLVAYLSRLLNKTKLL